MVMSQNPGAAGAMLGHKRPEAYPAASPSAKSGLVGSTISQPGTAHPMTRPPQLVGTSLGHPGQARPLAPVSPLNSMPPASPAGVSRPMTRPPGPPPMVPAATRPPVQANGGYGFKRPPVFNSMPPARPQIQGGPTPAGPSGSTFDLRGDAALEAIRRLREGGPMSWNRPELIERLRDMLGGAGGPVAAASSGGNDSARETIGAKGNGRPAWSRWAKSGGGSNSRSERRTSRTRRRARRR